MRTPKKIYKKNIRVSKELKERLLSYANGDEISKTVTRIVQWYNVDFNLHSYNENIVNSIKYSSVQNEPTSTNSKGDMITIKIDMSDYDIFENNCTSLGIDTSEGIRRAIRQITYNS